MHKEPQHMKENERLKKKNAFDGNLIYGADVFNRRTERDKHLKNREENIIPNYINKKTGELKGLFVNSRECPLCAENDYYIIFNKSGFDHVKCNVCEMVYVNPILKDEKLHNLYLDEQSYNKVLTNKLQIELDRKRFNYNLEIAEEYIKKPGELLDIGAGPGVFVEVARERGWNPTAIEFNSFCVNRIKALGIKCINQPLEKADLHENSFDCITLWAVLEHIQDPQAMLRKINQLLKPNGILVILVPNMDSLAARIMHEKCVTFSGDTHINFFNNETLSRIHEMNGFKVLDSETVFSEINTIKNYLNFEDPYFGNGKIDFDFISTKYIHDNLIGYCLVTYSQKI